MKFRSKEDMTLLYELADKREELQGVIFSPEEDGTEDLMLIFKEHTVTFGEIDINSNFPHFTIQVEKRYNNVRQRLEEETKV